MNQNNAHAEFMQAAIEEAQQGLAEGGIPIGSVLVYQNKIIGRGHNRRIQNGSPTLHGEMDALENAKRQPAQVYQQCTIYTTLSPCSMCSGAILLYKIPQVIIGENLTFMGEEALLESRGVKTQVLQDETCIALTCANLLKRIQLSGMKISGFDRIIGKNLNPNYGSLYNCRSE